MDVSKLNSVERSKYIDQRYKEYLKSSFAFSSSKLQSLFLEQLEKEKLFKGPYVDMNFPFERGKNLTMLMKEGLVSKSFSRLGDINFERPLYAHQEDSLRLIKNGRNAIVTTGTGSGKTECFLYPILNEILFDIESGNNEKGIRAVFLYPMNALVNDQIQRIRKMLRNCPDITFGFFTGETPEYVKSDYRLKTLGDDGAPISDNELVSREEIRSNPPHLLFTNYSMLEYLLIRPGDYSIFNPELLKNWKFIVLDEAHTYQGTLGIEISMLLRRLTGLAIRKPRFILTSATLGEKNKSEDGIIKFAKSLTSSEFLVSDIIFSKRIPLTGKPLYRIKGEDYKKIKALNGSLDEIKKIADEYISSSANTVGEILYDLLVNDKNVHDMSSLLKTGSKDFEDLNSKMSDYVSEDELIVLIDLINVTDKKGVGLFELKYHSFVRPLSGAYITYGNTQLLSLTKTNEIDGMKAFEVGNCRYCNSPYIIGKIQRKEGGQLDYLLQNKEIDIYENYGNTEHVKIDFFLLDDTINEDVVKDGIESYTVCGKCGEIHLSENLNARQCECGDEYRFTVYGITQKKEGDESYLYNNIIQCPCCGHRKESGVVKALNIGKDEGTALIAQILYEAIDDGAEEATKLRKQSLSLNPKATRELVKDHIKQYLVFSDSRQQASFSAVFFDANHVRMLRKRLIWEVVQTHNYDVMTIDELTAYLEERIKASDLFRNDMSAHKNAWATVLVDLLKVDGVYDGEGMGLYYFDLDIKSLLDNFEEEEISQSFPGFDMTKEKLYTLMQVVFGIFKITPAINYVKSTLSPEERLEILEYRRFSNYVTLVNSKKKRQKDTEERSYNGIRSFLPVGSESNMIVRYVMKSFGVDTDKAKSILEQLFQILEQTKDFEIDERIFDKHPTKDAYQINANKYIIKNYKTSKYYQCDKCKRLTPYNINNKCVQDKCSGTLFEVDPDEALSNNYYRKQYKQKKIERVVIKEHTAQLAKQLAREYQNSFKNKDINILSCSTTFEMGIDLGSLETVFMRNVPPTPANYVQRAGRAGRRKESTAYVLTYCETKSHDYTYYSEPEKLISGVIEPPYFNVLNKKIIVRHLMACSLGFFFRVYSDYYSNLESFIFKGGIEAFNDYMKSKPADLNEYISNKVLEESIYDDYKDFKWLDEKGEYYQKMQAFVDDIRTMVKEFEEALNEAKRKQEDGDIEASRNVTYYIKQVRRLKGEGILEYLSRYSVIPRYGFPIEVVELQVYENGVIVNSKDLDRDLKIAIAEYAPDSEVIADGKKYTSKYIVLNKQSEFPKNWFVTCSNCRKVNVFLSHKDTRECKYCGSLIAMDEQEYYIEPVKGFKTGPTKESTRLKPKKSYAGEVSYIGNGKIDQKRIIFGQVLGIETSSNDELLILNKSTFYMCPTCGYSDIVKGKAWPSMKKKHKNYKQFDCENELLEVLRLGHKFQTDVARITIPMLTILEKHSYAQTLSFLFAFLEGVSISLGIERRDLDGVLETNLECESYDLILYDNVPGGAGHVKRLLNRDAIINSLKAALAKVSKDCCDENTSCYNCLRNYNNQQYHTKLQRKLAIDVIKRLLFDVENVREVYQDDHWNWSRSNIDAHKRVKLSLGMDGRNPGNETASEIWSDLLEDSYDEEEIAFLHSVIEKSPKYIAQPYYSKTVKNEETGEKFVANLIWDTKQVMVFLKDSFDDYLLAKKTGWDVYCVKDGFDIDELLKKVSID